MIEPIVSLDKVTIYQQDNLVLSDVCLEVNKGDFVYIIGKTGSGKSSLMKILYADLPVSIGKAQVVGFSLNDLKEQQIPYLRRKLGVVFQDFRLLPDRNIFDNFAFVLRATGWKDPSKIALKIKQVLTKVKMQTKEYKFPHQLSGGEQQRVGIARALLNDPELILADEPTGNLDPQTSKEVLDILKEINQSGRTIIMATHDYALLLKYPAKTLRCEKGKIIEVVAKATTTT